MMGFYARQEKEGEMKMFNKLNTLKCITWAEAEEGRQGQGENIYYDGHVNKLGFYMRIRDVCPFLLMC